MKFKFISNIVIYS